MTQPQATDEQLALLAGLNGLTLSPERLAALRPLLVAMQQGRAVLDSVELGDTAPMHSFDARQEFADAGHA